MNSKLHTKLRERHISVTAARLAAFSIVASEGPLAIKAFASALQRQGYDRATAYRTLSVFRRLGIVQDIIAGGKKLIELTDQFDEHHHHLTCLRCGLSRAFVSPNLETNLQAIASSHGFGAFNHQVELSGLCTSCSAADNPVLAYNT